MSKKTSRTAAEMKLRSQPDQRPDSVPVEDLLHELQIHQVELEMQNEELQRAHIALEQSRDRYILLYDFSPVGYLTLTDDGRIRQANLTAATLLGTARAELITQRFAHYILEADADRWHRLFQRSKTQGEKQSCELTLRRANGSLVAAYLDCLPLVTEQGLPVLHIALSDVSMRKQAEEVLRLSAIAFDAAVGMFVTGPDKVILRANRACADIYGYTIDELVGQVPSIFEPLTQDETHNGEMWKALGQDGFWQGEILDRRKNGESFPVWLTITAVLDHAGGVANYIGSMTDLTVQKKAESELESARAQLQMQMATTQAELEKTRQDSGEVHAALNVLLKYRETDRSEFGEVLSLEIESTILPFLKKLRTAIVDKPQAGLLDIVEANLRTLMQSHGRLENIASLYRRLTPAEIRVASLVRQGLTTKAMAGLLNLSAETINSHRKHIRSKLGLDGKRDNLRAVLMSLSER